MYRFIIVNFLILLTLLYIVKSRETFEFFKSTCKKCDDEFIAKTLVNMKTRIDKLQNKVKTDVLGLKITDDLNKYASITTPKEKHLKAMNNWYSNKINPKISAMKNKDGSIKTEKQINEINSQKNKAMILLKKMENRLNKNKKVNRKSFSPSEKLADKLVKQTINASIKNKDYNELLIEWGDLMSGNIIRDTDRLNDKMKEILEKEFDKKERLAYKNLLTINYKNLPDSGELIRNLNRMSDEDLDAEIKNILSRPIVSEAKFIAKQIAILSKFTAHQLRVYIKIIKESEMGKAKNDYDNI
tara:strand:+ start:2580 stop:3479 length:900 start_codon:yes stop_codon:yes gene_type:complete